MLVDYNKSPKNKAPEDLSGSVGGEDTFYEQRYCKIISLKRSRGWLQHHKNMNGFDDKQSLKKTPVVTCPRGFIGRSKHIFSKCMKKFPSRKIVGAVGNEDERYLDDLFEGTNVDDDNRVEENSTRTSHSSTTKRDGDDLMVWIYSSPKHGRKLKHPDPSNEDAQPCNVAKSNSNGNEYSIHRHNDFETGNGGEFIVRPYKSSKVCFDLTPRYADGICCPKNARHHNNDNTHGKNGEGWESNLRSDELWYTPMDFCISRRVAYFLVKQKKDVQNYVKCVNRYLQDQNTETDNQHRITTTKGLFQGIHQGYRGLEVFGQISLRHKRIQKYVQAIVQFSSYNRPTTTTKMSAATTDNNSDDDDCYYMDKLRIYSESLTLSSRTKAWCMAQVDAIAARVVEL